MRRGFGVGALVLVAALAGCSGAGKPAPSSSSPTSWTVDGTLELHTTSLGGGSLEDIMSGKVPCKGAGGYDDIAAGAQVTVTDETGKVVGVGNLAGGRYGDSGACLFTFEVDGVQPGRPFYGVEVSHRGVVRFQGDAVKEPKLTLGD